MRYEKLTPDQRKIKGWRNRRNKLVQEILAQDRYISRDEALRKANCIMSGKTYVPLRPKSVEIVRPTQKEIVYRCHKCKGVKKKGGMYCVTCWAARPKKQGNQSGSSNI